MCVASMLCAQTAGTLTFSFTPVSHTGYSGTKNVLAVWIQSSNGTFIKTKLRYAGSGTADHLPTWAVNSGGTKTNCLAAACNKTDATTGATLSSFTAKKITWDGKNVNGTSNGTVVADGVYKVTIEETWDHGTGGTTTSSYTFTKGPNPDHQSPADNANFTGVKVDWVPATITGVDEPVAKEEVLKVYPNPSSGIVNVEYNKAGTIRVMDLMGAVVYEENITNVDLGQKSIDLSAFANGIYVLNMFNDEGSWNYKVALSK